MLQHRIKNSMRWGLLLVIVLGATLAVAADNTRSPHGNLNISCQNCHTVYGWKPIRAVPEFDHNTQTKFPLRGMHEGVNCVNCHTKMVFSNVGTKCADCHADIHRGKMSGACESCHTVRGWNVNITQINMHSNRFPLTGAHAAATCEDCHKNGGLSQFTAMSTDCISCHQKDFSGTTNPSHTSATLFSTTPCQNCHNTNNWASANFDHSLTGFPLVGSHTVPPRSCTDCHTSAKPVLTAAETVCIACHQNDYNNTTNPSHLAQSSLFPTTCQNCHTTVAWQPAQFDHSVTQFPLTGAHTVPPRACADCHKNNNYNITVTTCVSCHLTDFQNTNNPNHVQGGFPQTCETCHTTTAWQPANFDHSKTAFPLTGAHTVPPRQCADCHINGNYNITNTACVSCHQTDFNNAKTPVDHIGANFPTTCANCHDTVAWTDGKFDHASTGWALTGSHTVPPRACSDCHTATVGYNITDTTCVSCHRNDFNNAKTPVDHVGANFPTTCANCHDTVAWTDGKFDHSSTGFALTGLHTVPPRTCADCHVNNNYNITNTACVSCHQTDYNNTNNPAHAAQGIPTTCEVCHTTGGWSPAQFDHSKSGFPLTGAHTVPPRACSDCHVNNNYNITNTACVSCHQTDYNNATSPVNHVAAKFPTTCATCHDTVAWTDGVFDHSSTGFTLTGSHTVPPRACSDCHVNGNYNITVTTCVSCHQTDYNNALTPVNHPAAKFPTTCEGCHDTLAWTDGTFNHSTTGFVLTGAHTVPPRACTDCHTATAGYNITTTACVSCHQTDYNNAISPVNHVAAKFPTTCDGCHDTIQWSDGKFDHSTTGWALTGSHTVPPRACSDCHVNGNYNITVTTCVSCHQTDYNNALTPVNHPQAGFPTTCDTCHDTIQWTDGKFDHSTTGWALTGSHTVPPRACSDCHTATAGYNITSTTCVSCHQTDYNNAITPVNHVAAKFPTTCDGCHDTIAWTDGTFNHATTGWALTGSHTVPPRACSDCHTATAGYNITNTACVSCHQNDYNTATTPVNHITANFPTTCDTCHDTILWTDGKFDHSTTGWALTGSHTVPPRACTDCHTATVGYRITSTACVTCHQTDYNNTNNPAHAAAGFPTTCDVCHDTIAWTDSTFNHNNTAFPLQGPHTVPPRQCIDCHVNNNYTTLPTDCYGCHAADYNGTTNPNHKAAGFPTTCVTCHTTWVTTNWLGATFNHTWFPMTHGNANGVCATCHTNPSDYSVFQCTNCHTKSTTDANHQGVRNYVYNSINCYQCHPTGTNGP